MDVVFQSHWRGYLHESLKPFTQAFPTSVIGKSICSTVMPDRFNRASIFEFLRMDPR